MAKKNYYAWILNTGESGITKTWTECEAIIAGKSSPVFKGYSTFAEAWNHICPGTEVPLESSVFDARGKWMGIATSNDVCASEEQEISATWVEVPAFTCDEALPFEPSRFYRTSDSIVAEPEPVILPGEDFFKENDDNPFNNPMDIPESITQTVHDYFGVGRLSEMPAERIAKLCGAKMFEVSQETDYSDKAEAYLLGYMPVNFYKVWKPLINLLKKEKLPEQAKIMELGPGPGTATMGTISFYSECARIYPEKQYRLNITVLERAVEFIKIFQSMITGLRSSLPDNLEVEVSFVHTDALEGTFWNSEGYDLLLESNMLNGNENVSDEAIERYSDRVLANLKEGGIAILIEPGKKNDYANLKHIADKMFQNMDCLEVHEPLSTDVSAISLKCEAEEMGLRNTIITEHWFSYLVMERKNKAE